MTDDETQLTLTGEEMDLEPIECEKYPGCKRDAEYVVQVLSYEVGEEVDVKCCERCKSEFSEWVKQGKIRELSRRERFA